MAECDPDLSLFYRFMFAIFSLVTLVFLVANWRWAYHPDPAPIYVKCPICHSKLAVESAKADEKERN